MASTQGLERSRTLGDKILPGEENSVNRTVEMNVPNDPAETFQLLDTDADGSLNLAEVGDFCLCSNLS